MVGEFSRKTQEFIQKSRNILKNKKTSANLRMVSEKIRKDVTLPNDVLEILQKAADKELRSLKSYMEKVLIKHSDRIKDGLQQSSN